MLPLSGACTPKIVIDIMQRPMISDISASFSCPKPGAAELRVEERAPQARVPSPAPGGGALTGAHSSGGSSSEDRFERDQLGVDERRASTGAAPRTPDRSRSPRPRVRLPCPGNAANMPVDPILDRREQVVVGDDPELAVADRLRARGSATCAGVCPVGPVKPSRIISRTDSAISVRCSTPSAAGRLRSDSITLVSTELGHSTLTPIGVSSMASSCASVSEIETTAALVAQYGPMNGGAAEQPADRRGVDDVARRPLLAHDREERVHPVDDAPEVDVDDPPPVVERLVAHQVERRDAGVVAQHVDASVPLDASSRPGARPRRRRTRRRRPRARRRHRRGCPAATASAWSPVEVGDHDRRALARRTSPPARGRCRSPRR